jgi:hypothetical protein
VIAGRVDQARDAPAVIDDVAAPQVAVEQGGTGPRRQAVRQIVDESLEALDEGRRQMGCVA